MKSKRKLSKKIKYPDGGPLSGNIDQEGIQGPTDQLRKKKIYFTINLLEMG